MMRKQTNRFFLLHTFRRWSRTPFAVFNSLGKMMRIGVLSIGCSILIMPVFASENRDTIPPNESQEVQDLDEVVVSAQLAPMLQSDLMRVVQVISRSEIEQAPARDIAGLLAQVRGVDIRERGPAGVQADISIRGGTFDQTLILLNGVNITDPQTGHHNLNLPVDLQSIERIEILKGPGARVFGPNAFSGAVNIITRDPEKAYPLAQVSVGQHGLFRSYLSSGFKTGNAGHFLSANYASSNGYTNNTDFQLGNLYLNSRIPLGRIELDAQAGYNQKAFGANSFYTPVYPEQFEETQTLFASLQLQPTENPDFISRVYWRRHTDRFELFRDEAPDWYSNHNYHLTNIAGINSQWRILSGWGKTSLGLDARYENILSSVLGNPLDEPVNVGYGNDNFYTNEYNRTGVGLLVEHNLLLNKFSVTAGSLIYANTSLDSDLTLFPGIDFAYKPAEGWRVFSSLNRTLRLPTFTDLFYNGPSNRGNVNLQPEKAVTAELGFTGNFSLFSFSSAVFHRWGVDMIDWVKSPGDELWRSMNHTRVNMTGFETGLDIFVGQWLAILRPSVHYTYLHADKSADNLVSNYTLDYLKHQLDIITHWQINANLSIQINTSWRERQGGYMIFEDGIFTETVDFKPFWLIDTRVAYTFGNLEVFTSVTNLLDSDQVSIANVPQPGRWITGGLRYQLSSYIPGSN